MSSARALCPLVLILVFSCAGCLQRPAFQPVQDSFPRAVRLQVPFVPQTKVNDCGPAALASVLAFHGRHVALDEVTRRVFTPGLGRSLLPDMENHARSLGFTTRSGRGDLDMVRAMIDSGGPVILMLDMGTKMFSQGHYVVVYGYDPGGLLMHVGTSGDMFLPNRDLLDRWERMNRLYLFLE